MFPLKPSFQFTYNIDFNLVMLYFILVSKLTSATYGRRNHKILGELSIIEEAFTFCIMVCDVRKLKRM